ncbi:MAG: FHA domain-containing protein [Solirubrobacterales bacterium]
MDSEPIAVALKFGFLAVLYVFLFWAARSAIRDVRGTPKPEAADATGFHDAGSPAAATDAWLHVLRGGALEPGSRIDLFGGVTIGRSAEADVQIEDRYSSSIHARVHARSGAYYVEDMGSTNGTYLNGNRLDHEAQLADLDEIRIGDTELRFEYELPSGG